MNDLKLAQKLELKAKQLRDKRKSKDRYDTLFTEVTSIGDIAIYNGIGDKLVRLVSFETFEKAYKHAKKYQPKKGKTA
jgi:hypothetical protein